MLSALTQPSNQADTCRNKGFKQLIIVLMPPENFYGTCLKYPSSKLTTMQLDRVLVISPSKSCPTLIVDSCVTCNIVCAGECFVSITVYLRMSEGIEDGADGEGGKWGGV